LKKLIRQLDLNLLKFISRSLCIGINQLENRIYMLTKLFDIYAGGFFFKGCEVKEGTSEQFAGAELVIVLKMVERYSNLNDAL